MWFILLLTFFLFFVPVHLTKNLLKPPFSNKTIISLKNKEFDLVFNIIEKKSFKKTNI
jgi:hypothetical protein